MTLDLIRIFMLEIQLGSVICECCVVAYVFVGMLRWLCVCCVVVCFYIYHVMGFLCFSHMMVGIGDRPS